MAALAGQTVQSFGYDKSNTNYTFNSLGYRSDVEFTATEPIVIVGNSLSFGLGMDLEYTYGRVLQERIHHPVYNMSWGAYAHTNYELLTFLKTLLPVMKPKMVIFQINNLNRYRHQGVISFDNPPELVLSEYQRFYDEFARLTKAHNIYPIHWDEQSFGVDFSWCRIYNKYQVDSNNMLPQLFGPKTHRLIAEKIIQDIV